jgi:predicted RecB family nuclease
MRLVQETLNFSPSDLTAFLACERLTQLQLAVARGEIEKPDLDDPIGELLRAKGDEHERRYLQELRDEGREIIDIDFSSDFDWARAANDTEEAMRRGVAVIYQACLMDGDWRGFADFIERQDDGLYEVVDTKLARHTKPEHLLQLCFYSAVIGRIQRRNPEEMHVVLGNGRRESFRVSDYDAFYRRVRARFHDVVEKRPETYPYPVAHCAVCPFKSVCEQRWADDDHLVQVARITRKQVERLTGAGITGLADLAHADLATRVERIEPSTFEALRQQAVLQLHKQQTGEHRVVLLPPATRRGFALLPLPDAGDVYFDIEGDPFYAPEGGLEYLFGIAYREDGELHFKPFWATDRVGEKRAFEELVDFLVARRRAFPGMHVYHYANYERSAFERLMQIHGTREDNVDDLFRGEVLVDLYQVVRQALRISIASYSLKKVEELYFPGRETDVVGGDESTVVFERWLESGEVQLLKQIEDYNRDDCMSTAELHRWLLTQRPSDLPWAEPPPPYKPSEEAETALTERDELAGRLLERANEGDARWLAAHLLHYHERNAKPAWWDYFRRLTLDAQQLLDDSDAIGGITPDKKVEPWPLKKSLVYELTFPPQELKIGPDAVDPATKKSPGQILAIDEDAGRIQLKRGEKKQLEPLPEALVAPGPLRDVEQRCAVERVARALADGTGEYRAAQDILTRAAPRTLLDGSFLDATLALDHSYLFVQGPPGSGKTWNGAAVAVELMRRGRRVGVASTSHKAIHKFLDDVVEHADRLGVDFSGLKKCSAWEATRFDRSDRIDNSDDNDDFVDDNHALIAGTAWLFAREGVRVDTLFLDEAGQISLADALAMATAAKNVVLLGDPNQLSQVTQGAQPRPVRASVLEHLLGTDTTVPPSRGLFLEQTWRLRPELCAIVSAAFYENRLRTADVCSRRDLSAGVGLRFVEIEHSGHRQRSPEEAHWIRAEIRRLLGATFTDEAGNQHVLAEEHILVVAAYNAQVRCLREQLPHNVRVGTVDKFQGQQAPVVFFSMATSSGSDLPRGIEFLFSPNRINVAISRAQCLAYIVGSPLLLVADARTPEQMRLLNTVCRLAEIGSVEHGTEPNPRTRLPRPSTTSDG